MPNWKKIVTSGSNAAFNSLIVSSTITGSISGSLTGSLQGTASWAEYVVNGSTTNTGSLLTTASVNLNIITFTKGNNTQFSITVNTGSGGTVDTSNLVTTSSFNAFTSSVNTFTASYNTGSFSGSFTGSFNGTASWARNALTASFLPVGTYQITSSWAINALTASFAPNYLLTSSFELWTGSVSSRFSGTSSYANFTRIGRISGSLPGDIEEGGNVYVLPIYRSGNAIFGSTGSVYTTPLVSSTGILHYSASLDRILTTASWAVNALTASYAENAPSALPGGNFGEIQFNSDGTFNGVPLLTYTSGTLTGTGSFSGNLRLGLFRGAQTDIVVASGTDEVLIYTFPIPARTFTDDDVIRVRWRTYNQSKNAPEYYIYIADTDDFNTIVGSSSNIIAFCTASNNTISYLQMKRDFSLNTTDDTLDCITTSIPLITDDTLLVNATPIKTFAMDWNRTDYWMFFSAKPNTDTNLCVSKYCTVERI
jgi:hypothetical protein